jgi:hypothetical protein
MHKSERRKIRGGEKATREIWNAISCYVMQKARGRAVERR